MVPHTCIIYYLVLHTSCLSLTTGLFLACFNLSSDSLISSAVMWSPRVANPHHHNNALEWKHTCRWCFHQLQHQLSASTFHLDADLQSLNGESWRILCVASNKDKVSQNLDQRPQNSWVTQVLRYSMILRYPSLFAQLQPRNCCWSGGGDSIWC